VDAIELRHHGTHLVAGEHRGNAPRASGAHRLLDAWKVDPQHLAIQEQQRAERLVLGGRGYVALHGEPGEERLNFTRPHLARVPLSVVHHEAVHPLRVRPLGPQTEVLEAGGLPDLVQKLGLGHRFTTAQSEQDGLRAHCFVITREARALFRHRAHISL
jgi:hypothetical protein